MIKPKKNSDGEDSRDWVGIAAIVVTLAMAGLGAFGLLYANQEVSQANQGSMKTTIETHIATAEAHEEKQDLRIDAIASKSHDNAVDIAGLKPLTADKEVAHAIRLVQTAIECQETISDDSEWIYVPGASGDCLPDDLRVRVEEHFRSLGYDVSRQRESEGRRWLGFWIFVKQANEV